MSAQSQNVSKHDCAEASWTHHGCQFPWIFSTCIQCGSSSTAQPAVSVLIFSLNIPQLAFCLIHWRGDYKYQYRAPYIADRNEPHVHTHHEPLSFNSGAISSTALLFITPLASGAFFSRALFFFICICLQLSFDFDLCSPLGCCLANIGLINIVYFG